MRILYYLLLVIIPPTLVWGQQSPKELHEQCTTMEKLQLNFKRHPELKEKFERERIAFTEAVKKGAYRLSARETGGNNRTIYTIPVVFHVVLTNPDVVTEARIQA